ncbi:MAG TPA: phenylacetic acid degradation protein PaaD [Cytophagales bacterium]|nr:phenylacetic acid degradation protein PaaD [Cytophagales bacterium]HCR55073.1 phenylacetic acid degradation protein PaaD [Cytophagales bacterium]
MNTDNNPYASLLGIEVVEVSAGMARVKTRVAPQHTNHLGYTHGGFLYSVADYAFELASNSHGIDAVGLTTSMEFHRPSTVGTALEAVAREIHLGKNIATYHIEVMAENKRIASFTGTVYRKS